MITRIIKLHVKDSHEEFITYVNSVWDEVTILKGCRNMELLNDKEEKSIFFIYTIWDTEKDLTNFRNSELNKNFWNKLLELSEQRPEVWTVENIIEK